MFCFNVQLKCISFILRCHRHLTLLIFLVIPVKKIYISPTYNTNNIAREYIFVNTRKFNNVRCLCQWPLPVKCCIILIYVYARLLGSLSREGSLSCHTCCDRDPRFFGGFKKTPKIVSLYDSQAVKKTDSYQGTHRCRATWMESINQSTTISLVDASRDVTKKKQVWVSVLHARI